MLLISTQLCELLPARPAAWVSKWRASDMAKLTKRAKAAQEKVSRTEAKPLDEALALVKDNKDARELEKKVMAAKKKLAAS